MGQNLTAGQTTAITAPVRHPRLLVQITLAATTLRLSYAETVTFDGNTFSKSGVLVSDVKNGKGGIVTARLKIPNEENVYTQLTLSGAFDFAPVKIWQYYGTGNPSTDDVIVLLDGEIYAVPDMGPAIVFDCATTGAMTRMMPDLTLGAPDLNHMPFAGQQFRIGNEVYIVEIR
tara:strand:- start:11821 stop:12342 length:522 start_codon:yes stop_codon:yes gene_type:complete